MCVWHGRPGWEAPRGCMPAAPFRAPKPCGVQGLVGGRLPSEDCQVRPLSLPVAGPEFTQGAGVLGDSINDLGVLQK